MLDHFCYIRVEESQEKANIVREVLLDLPEWFGLAESTEQYIEESKKLILFEVKNNDNVIGFITLKETSKAVCEIHCMGIKKSYHKMGIGKKLYNIFEKYAKEKYEFIQVKTVDEGHYKEYDKTIAFYKKLDLEKWKFSRRYGMNGIHV